MSHDDSDHADAADEPGGSAVHPDLVTGANEPPADASTGDAGAGGLDIGALLAAAGEMQTQLSAAQDQAAAQELEGVAGGGAVRITVTGGGEFLRVQIAPEAVDPADVDLLCDLVLAALHDATAKVQELQAASVGGLGDLLGGAGLDLGGLFGGPGA